MDEFYLFIGKSTFLLMAENVGFYKVAGNENNKYSSDEKTDKRSIK